MSQKTRKNAFGTSPLVPNWVQGIQVGSKNQAKIDPNMESKMECILASIFYAFQWILGGKLGGKTDQKSIQKGIRKKMEKIRMQIPKIRWVRYQNLNLNVPKTSKIEAREGTPSDFETKNGANFNPECSCGS